jgi:hypothetical protein
VARVFIEKIAKANGNLASVGAWLYKVQQGRIAIYLLYSFVTLLVLLGLML